MEPTFLTTRKLHDILRRDSRSPSANTTLFIPAQCVYLILASVDDLLVLRMSTALYWLSIAFNKLAHKWFKTMHIYHLVVSVHQESWHDLPVSSVSQSLSSL